MSPPSLPPPSSEDESLYPKPYAAGVAAAEEQPAPPLSIQHLFLWTTCIAIVAGVAMSLIGSERSPAMIMPLLFRVGVDGTSLAAAVLWVGRRFVYRIPFPTQPGHWHLLGMFFVGLASYAQDLLVLVWGAVAIAPLFLAAIVFLLGAWFTSAWRAWQVYFAALGVFYGGLALYSGLLLTRGPGMTHPVTPSIEVLNGIVFVFLAALATAVIAWIVAVILDRLYSAPRDWLHYVGVALPVISVLEGAASAMVALVTR